jgi:hypothetical protein
MLWRFTLVLILSLRRLTQELYVLTLESWRLILVVFWSHGGSPYIGGGSFKSAEALLGSLEALSAAAKAYSGAVEGHRGSVELVLVLNPWDAIFLHCVHRVVIEIP